MSAQVELRSIHEIPNYPDDETCRRGYWFTVDSQSETIWGTKIYPRNDGSDQEALFEIELNPSNDISSQYLEDHIDHNIRLAKGSTKAGRGIAGVFGTVGISGAVGEVVLAVNNEEDDPTLAFMGGAGILVVAGLAAYWQLRFHNREAKQSLAKAARLEAIADHLGLAVTK